MDTQWLYNLSLIGLSYFMIVDSFPVTNSDNHRTFINEVVIAINDMNATHDPILIIEIIEKCQEYETMFVNDVQQSSRIFFKKTIERACPTEIKLLRDYYTKVCNGLKNKSLMMEDLKRRVMEDIKQQQALSIQLKNNIIRLLYGAEKKDAYKGIYEKIEKCLNERHPIKSVHLFHQIINETKENLDYNISTNKEYMESLEKLQFMKKYPKALIAAKTLIESYIKGLEQEKKSLEMDEAAVNTAASIHRTVVTQKISLDNN
ncbi:hypothetical protein BdWA1_002911 [Babesia duncani]|uniref:Uncharacterized protein n=1 Tax=Babesia duncani TaxID=323732 RepID=A0AAD9PH01_9APIC|nr:hypothetical protein BdWA1_003936 [Babesia duncani]KAK2195238.1 hypothetical protein BdWA1_002911 [Babesia duncani]